MKNLNIPWALPNECKCLNCNRTYNLIDSDSNEENKFCCSKCELKYNDK